MATPNDGNLVRALYMLLQRLPVVFGGINWNCKPEALGFLLAVCSKWWPPRAQASAEIRA